MNVDFESSVVPDFDDEEAVETDHCSPKEMESSDQLHIEENKSRDFSQSGAESSPSSLDVNIDCDTDTHTQPQVLIDTQTDIDIQVPVTDVQGVRTRAGRVVKKVNRLIESMVQKPFYLQGVGSNLKKRSGSFLSLF